ncbi:MAG: hypothetical protein U0Q18_04730 [Bryobacteraceae bacterium]
MDSIFDRIAADASGAFDLLEAKFLEEKQYGRLFEMRLLRKRQELGLPLIQPGGLDEIPADKRPAYERAFIDAAREAGTLYLEAGDIPRAWSYFRALGDPAPVAAAIESAQPGESVHTLVEIAFHEGVNLRKGFELVVEHYGLCRAITYFQQYPPQPGRTEALHLLIRTLYRDLVEGLRRAIERAEGQAPATENVMELMEGRPWLFGEFSYYVDTSHLISILGFCVELEDPEMLRLALELAEYGQRLSSQFQYPGEPPFENHRDYILYFRARLGRDEDAAIANLREKPNSGKVLVDLLARLGRYREAIAAALEFLPEEDPTALQLCQTAGEFDELARLARSRDDLIGFAAAMMQRNAMTRRGAPGS